MANATLVINDTNKFSDDVWQTGTDFSSKEWDGVLKEMVNLLNKLYTLADTESFNMFIEEFSKGFPELYFGDYELYQLGDICNMLNSIDVKVKGE